MPKFNWDKIRTDYEVLGLSGYKISLQKNTPSRQAINDRAKAESWSRDFSKDLADRVSAKVALIDPCGDPNKTEKALEKEAVTRSQVELRHRSDLSGVANLLSNAILEASLDHQSADKSDYKSAKWVAEQTAIQRLSKERLGVVAMAVSSLTQLQAAERIAYRLDESGSADTGSNWTITIVDPQREESE